MNHMMTSSGKPGHSEMPVLGRVGHVERETKESHITVDVDLDGRGVTDISTGLPFFDHMLVAMGTHGSFDLSVHAEGDLEVDAHHTVEDTAISLGEAFFRPWETKLEFVALDQASSRWMRRWLKLSWMCLGAHILLPGVSRRRW